MSKLRYLFLAVVLSSCTTGCRRAELPVLDEVPILGIFEEQRKQGSRTFVTIRSPSIEGVGVDLWCYEDEFGQPERIEEEGGRLLLHHEYQGNTLETLFEPEPGGVVITATLTGPNRESSSIVRTLNVCVTYQRSQAFGNRKDKFDESYLDDYVGRSFLFLEGGLTRLSDTNRVPSEDGRDNPYSARGRAPRPFVQEYAPTWRSHAALVHTFYGKRPLSPDRPTYPIMGVVSHDERFLSAFAWPDTGRLGQLFISCLHPSPQVEDTCNSEIQPCVTRGKIYFMENNPERLLRAFEQDFPDWERPPDVE